MKILAIESSCDDTAVSIVEDGRNVLSSKVSSQVDIHKIYGGVVPEIASRNHIKNIGILTNEVFKESGLTLKDISAIGVTYAPGLIGSLLVGVNFAKGLALSSGLPVVPVHHIKSHIASLYISNKSLEPPFLCLVASGGHSHIFEVINYTNIKTVSKTRDDAAGEAFDKIGRRIGLDYPGGIALDALAEKGDPNKFLLPRPLKNENGTLDFSFSGLKTSMINIINNLEQKNEVVPVEDVAASFRKAVVDYLVENLMEASKILGYNKIAVAGGVSANSLLRKNLSTECEKRNYKLFLPKKEFCGDNAAMVGSQAYYEFLENNTAQLDLNAVARTSLLG